MWILPFKKKKKYILSHLKYILLHWIAAVHIYIFWSSFEKKNTKKKRVPYPKNSMHKPFNLGILFLLNLL